MSQVGGTVLHFGIFDSGAYFFGCATRTVYGVERADGGDGAYAENDHSGSERLAQMLAELRASGRIDDRDAVVAAAREISFVPDQPPADYVRPLLECACALYYPDITPPGAAP